MMKKCSGEYCFWLSDWGDTVTLSVGKPEHGSCDIFMDKKDLRELYKLLDKFFNNKDWSQGNDVY